METAQHADITAEDVFELPETQRRLVIPRRGDGTAPVEPVKDAVGTLRGMWEAAAGRVDAVAGRAGSDAGLVGETRRAGFGELAATTPLGAAIVAAFLIEGGLAAPQRRAVVDAWIGERGPAFAVEALLELGRVHVWALRNGDPRALVVREDEAGQNEERFQFGSRMREHLAAMPEQDHTEARETAARIRAQAAHSGAAGSWIQRCMASFLFPEQADWVAEDVAELIRNGHRHHDRLTQRLLLCAVSDTATATALASAVSWWWIANGSPQVIASMAAVLGPDLLPVLLAWYDGYADSDERRRLLARIAELPTDAAFRALLERIEHKHAGSAVLAASHRYPRRALRMLAEAAGSDTPKQNAAAALLRLHTLANAELAKQELATLGAAVRTRVEALLEGITRLPEAAAGDLPPLLASPPWLGGHKARKPVVISGLTPEVEPAVVWQEGEREDWSQDRVPVYAHHRNFDFQQIAESIAAGGNGGGWYTDANFVVKAPAEMVRPLLAVLTPPVWGHATWLPFVVARYGLDALPVALRTAKQSPAECAQWLMPFATAEVATAMADWYARLKTVRGTAQTWLKRHPDTAARALVPAAVGKAGPARRGAEAALRMLAASGFAEAVASGAEAYGAQAARAVADLIEDDGTLRLPKSMPEPPVWADPSVLPQILLRGRDLALPPDAVRAFLQMLAISTPAERYAGLARVDEACDRRSLTEFGWALFQSWRLADYPSKQGFPLDALRWYGDDEAVRRLAPLIRQWPGDGGHLRAVAGLDVLTAIGGHTALMHLYRISQKVKFKGLKEQAAARVQDIADELGLSADELGDRLVPDLGLDADGALTLDFGPRRFVVGFDEQLKPYVTDESGKRLKALPKPGVKDDPELAPAAAQQFSGLKKDARTLASDQIGRLELAMCVRRRWAAADFREYFVKHPLLRHIVRRLVWADFAADGTVRAAFRVAEDLSFADVADEAFTLPDDARVGLAHPLDLGSDLAAWSELFADYEILQPFAQLGRPVFAFSAEECAATRLARFAGVTVPAPKVLGLERRGWRRSQPADAGVQAHVLRDLPDGRKVVVDLEPGLWIGAISECPDQSFREIWVTDATGEEWYYYAPTTGGIPLSCMDPVTASEILRDLTEVTAQ